MKRLTLSKYTRTVERKEDIAVYHSLFGNLCIIDSDGYKILQSFVVSQSCDDVLKKFPQYQPSVLTRYIDQLIAKRFLILKGFDENITIREYYMQRRRNLHSGYLIRTLQLIMTNKCNYSCDYCFMKTIYSSDARFALQTNPQNITMSFDTAKAAIEKVLEIVRKNNNKELYVEFFGGEPLLNWNVIKRIMDIFNNGYDVTIRYSITTNGALITREMAETFNKYNATVTLSIDSFDFNGGLHSSHRKGSKQVIRGLNTLKKYNNWVTVNSVLSNKTIDEFDGRALIEKAKSHNVDMIGLILDLDLNSYKSAKYRRKALQQLWETYQWGEQKQIPVVGYWHQITQQIIGKQPTKYFSGYKTCPAAGCKLSVEPTGNVFICKCCSAPLGHIRDIENVLNSPQYETYALKGFQNPKCRGCEVEGFCSGICMGALEKKYNTITVIENNACNIYKQITRKLIVNLNADETNTLKLAQYKDVISKS